MRSRALQTSRLLRQAGSSLQCLQAGRPVAVQRPQLRIAAALTTASKPAPRTAARAAAKPVSTVTKTTARTVADKTTPAPAPAPAAAVPTARAAPVAHPEFGNGNGSEGAVDGEVDWSTSFQGVGTVPFSPEAAQILMGDLNPEDVEIKPDGIVYLPEIKYRRILNRAFGPGGWGMVPRGDLAVEEKNVTREYALIAQGRFVAQARGECQYFSEDTITTAAEGCKSNALMRCCKDIGIASELWDPRYIRNFKKAHCNEIWVEHATTKKKRQIWVRKDSPIPAYPYQIPKK